MFNAQRPELPRGAKCPLPIRKKILILILSVVAYHPLYREDLKLFIFGFLSDSQRFRYEGRLRFPE